MLNSQINETATPMSRAEAAFFSFLKYPGCPCSRSPFPDMAEARSRLLRLLLLGGSAVRALGALENVGRAGELIN